MSVLGFAQSRFLHQLSMDPLLVATNALASCVGSGSVDFFFHDIGTFREGMNNVCGTKLPYIH